MLETAAGVVLGFLALGLLLAFWPSVIRAARIVSLFCLTAAAAVWLFAGNPRAGAVAVLLGAGIAAVSHSPRSAMWTAVICAVVASAATGGWYVAGPAGMFFAPLLGFAAWAVWDWRRLA